MEQNKYWSLGSLVDEYRKDLLLVFDLVPFDDEANRKRFYQNVVYPFKKQYRIKMNQITSIYQSVSLLFDRCWLLLRLSKFVYVQSNGEPVVCWRGGADDEYRREYDVGLRARMTKIFFRFYWLLLFQYFDHRSFVLIVYLVYWMLHWF